MSGPTRHKLLLRAMWLGVARLKPDTDNIGVGGILFCIKVRNGLPVIDDVLAQELEKIIAEVESGGWKGGIYDTKLIGT